MMKFLGYFIIFVLVGVGIAFYFYYRESAKMTSPQATSQSKMSSSAQQMQDDWQVFESKEDKFQIYFPNPPQQQSKNANQLSYHTYLSESSEKETYLVTVVTFAQSVPANFLKDLKNTLLSSNEDSQLTSDTPVRINELEGDEFVIQDGAKETTTLSLVKNEKAYLLTVIQDRKKNQDEIDKRFFLNSFQLLP